MPFTELPHHIRVPWITQSPSLIATRNRLFILFILFAHGCTNKWTNSKVCINNKATNNQVWKEVFLWSTVCVQRATNFPARTVGIWQRALKENGRTTYITLRHSLIYTIYRCNIMSDAIYRIKTMMGGLGSEIELPMLPSTNNKWNYICTIVFPKAQTLANLGKFWAVKEDLFFHSLLFCYKLCSPGGTKCRYSCARFQGKNLFHQL